MASPNAPAAALEIPVCERCKKIEPLCVCDRVTPIRARTQLLVLQHPQEQDRDLGTARLAALHFENAVFKIGLSWPSLSKAIGHEADPKRWAVLYLGSAKPADFPDDAEVVSLDKKGLPVLEQHRALLGLDGIVLLDGTWSQAKTLWWRNAWMLKCRRLAIAPRATSLYGKLRKEPRKEALSSLESVGLLLSRIEKKPEIEKELLKTFARMLDKYRAWKAMKGGARV